MRADYDSEGDTIQIELRRVDRLDYGESIGNGAAIVGIRDGMAATIDVIGTGSDVDNTLREVAVRHDLEAEALVAVARAALAAPDRQVTLDVGASVAAS